MYALDWKKGVSLLGIGVALALVANWIRVIIVVLVGDYTEMEHRLVSDHNDLGWFVYGVIVLLPLLYVTGKLSSKGLPQTAQPVILEQQGGNVRRPLIVYTAAVCILVSAPALSALVRWQDFSNRSVSLPEPVGTWAATANRNPLWRANYNGASQYLYGEFGGGAGLVELHMFNYADQREGMELINVDNTLTDDEIWHIVPNTENRMVVSAAAAGQISVLTAEIESDSGQRKLVWYWFEVGGAQTNDAYIAKILQLFALVNGRKDASFIAVAADCRLDCVDTSGLLDSFIEDMYSGIKANL